MILSGHIYAGPVPSTTLLSIVILCTVFFPNPAHPSPLTHTFYTVSLSLHYVQNFIQAAKSGDVATVRTLLQSHVNVNTRSEVCGEKIIFTQAV